MKKLLTAFIIPLFLGMCNPANADEIIVVYDNGISYIMPHISAHYVGDKKVCQKAITQYILKLLEYDSQSILEQIDMFVCRDDFNMKEFKIDMDDAMEYTDDYVDNLK